MSLNATECCRTIGCNCGGTKMVENMNYLTTHYWILGLVIIIAAIVLLLIGYIISKYQNEQRARRDGLMFGTDGGKS